MAGIRALLGIFPKTSSYESIRNRTEEEYNALMSFSNSSEFKEFAEIESAVSSPEFAKREKELLAMRFSKTEDYQKEKDFLSLQKSKDISLYYKVKSSQQLSDFRKAELSDELKKYIELEIFIHSDEYKKAQQEAALSSDKRFARSDLAKALNQYHQQKKSDKISGYYKFLANKSYSGFKTAVESKVEEKINALEKKLDSPKFKQAVASMNKDDFKMSEEKQFMEELKDLKKSKQHTDYLEMEKSPFKKYYDVLFQSDELEAYEDLEKYIISDEFKKQKREIEGLRFKNTPEYQKLLAFEQLKKLGAIKHFNAFKESKEYKNFRALDGSERIEKFEELKKYIGSETFIKNKTYFTQSPKKRWRNSDEYANLMKYNSLKKSEKIVWFLKNRAKKRFAWLRVWSETFYDHFSAGKLEKNKWMTRYYWGEEMLNDSYSLSHDKHFVTDGKNIELNNSMLQIVTKKEVIKGKSWHHKMGFITREFGYTSGLISTGKSFRQKYGTFEAKIKFNGCDQIQDAFWMVSNTLVPHIDIAKANKKVEFGNAWGNPKELASIKKYVKKYRRSKLSSDFFIYSLEWRADKITWRINGLEVASTNQGIPQEAMYIIFSSGLHAHLENNLPATMEVDWVRCYQHTDFAK